MYANSQRLSRRGVEVSATQHRPRPRNRLSKARAPRVKAPWTEGEGPLDRQRSRLGPTAKSLLDHPRRLLGPTTKAPWTDSEAALDRRDVSLDHHRRLLGPTAKSLLHHPRRLLGPTT